MIPRRTLPGVKCWATAKLTAGIVNGGAGLPQQAFVYLQNPYLPEHLLCSYLSQALCRRGKAKKRQLDTTEIRSPDPSLIETSIRGPTHNLQVALARAASSLDKEFSPFSVAELNRRHSRVISMVESDECTAVWQDTTPVTWGGSALLASTECARETLAPRQLIAGHRYKTERLRPETSDRQPDSLDWATRFLQFLPLIRNTARRAFQHFDADQRDEAVQEVTANCFVAYAALVERGCEARAFASPLIRYALAQHRAGRRVGRQANRYDVTSPACQRQQGAMVQSIFHSPTDGEWDELLVQDRHSTPAEIVAIRLDFQAWLEQLSLTKRFAARLLASGASNHEVAILLRLSSARISQLRQELRLNWARFQGEATAPSSSVQPQSREYKAQTSR